MPVPPVPPAGTACSRQILCSTTGTTGPTKKRSRGLMRWNCTSQRRLFRPGARRVVEYFGVEYVKPGLHNVAAPLHFLLVLQLTFVGYQESLVLEVPRRLLRVITGAEHTPPCSWVD